MSTQVRIAHGVTNGLFTLDGQSFDVENNLWVVGDDQECIVIDAPHQVEPILELVAGRRVTAIVCTHAHDDHIQAVPELARITGAPVLLHPADAELWSMTHPDERPDADLDETSDLRIGNQVVQVMHTPGHTPGGVCLHLADLGVVFTGDTLFEGGPGATGRSFSDRGQLEHSIRTKLFALTDRTTVHTGHGPSTTIGAERVRAADEGWG